MGPIDNFLLRGGSLACLELALGSTLLGDRPLSAALMRELVVVAADTGCRGRELRNGGDSFGGGEEM